MTTTTIRLRQIDDVKHFVNIIMHFENVSVSVELDSSLLCEKSDGEMGVKA